MNFLEAARRLVSLDSTPSHGTGEVVEFLSELGNSFGMKAKVLEENLNGLVQPNLIFEMGAGLRSDEALLLQTHLDTAEPGEFSLWDQTNSNPFNVSIHGDFIFGLGVADTKLDFLCKMFAVNEVQKSTGIKRPLRLAGTFGAQSAMAGAMKLARRKEIRAKWALIGEPTDLKIVTAGPGMAVVEVSLPLSEEEMTRRNEHDLSESSSSQTKIFKGRAAHSAAPHLGENAIIKMLEYLRQLPEGIILIDVDGGINANSVPSVAAMEVDFAGDLRSPIVPRLLGVRDALLDLEKEFLGFSEEGLQPPHPTLNLGMIRCFEDRVYLKGSCRLPPSVEEDLYKSWMNQLGMKISSLGGVFRIADYKKGFSTQSESSFLNSARTALSQSDIAPVVQKSSASTEASVFSRLGVECLVFGPGQSLGNSHAPNESVKISDLTQAQKFYEKMIQEICG